MGNLLTTPVEFGQRAPHLRPGIQRNPEQHRQRQHSRYVKQDLPLESQPFDPTVRIERRRVGGSLVELPFGVSRTGGPKSTGALGSEQQKSADLGVVQPLFDLTATSTVPSALNKFFGGFSQLAVNPNDAAARQNVIGLGSRLRKLFSRTRPESPRCRTTPSARPAMRFPPSTRWPARSQDQPAASRERSVDQGCRAGRAIERGAGESLPDLRTSP